MGLYEKMYKVMTESEGLEKDLTVGKGQNSYKAVGEKEVLNQLKPLFKKHKLIVFPIDGDISENNSISESAYDGVTTNKARNITQLKCRFKIVDIETGENETLIGFGNGADSQDKGSGKAFTYAYKTMLSKTFMLFSGEDTDNEHSDDIGKTYTKPQKTEPTKVEPPKVDCISMPQYNELKDLALKTHSPKETAKQCLMDLGNKLNVEKMVLIKATDYNECVEFIKNWDDTSLPFDL